MAKETNKPFMVRSQKKAVEETKTKKEQLVKEAPKAPKTVQNAPKSVKEKADKPAVKQVKTATPKNEIKTTDKRKVVANARIVNEGELFEKEDILSVLNRHKETQTVLYGEVVGSEIDAQSGKAFATIQYRDVLVRIPDSAYFTYTYKFNDEYYSAKDKLVKAEMCKKAINQNLGSRCPFVIINITVRESEMGNHKGEEEIEIYGDRVKALDIRKDKYFLHKNTNEPVSINENDQAEANVIQVTEKYATLEVLGVEYRMDCYNLKEGHVVNCRDEVKTGDVIKVRFKKIRIQGTEVLIKVSGRLNLGSKQSRPLAIGGEYTGYIESENSSSKIWTVRLFNGDVATVPKQGGTFGYLEMTIGDRVSVMIKECKEVINENTNEVDSRYYYGIAMKI